MFFFSHSLDVDKYMLIDDSYANGDGTDSWCTTDIPIPNNVYINQAYKLPVKGTYSCTKGVLSTIAGVYVELYFDSSPTTCTNINTPYVHSVFFLCMQ